MWLFIISVIAACVTGGAFLVIKLDNRFHALIIVVCVGVIAFILRVLRSGGDGLFHVALGIGTIAFVASALITFGFKSVAACSSLFVKAPIFAILFLVAIFVLYLGLAWLSRLAYSPFNENVYWNQPMDVHLERRYPLEPATRPENDSMDWLKTVIFCDSQTGQPYNGIHYVYAMKMKTATSKPKATGLSYLIEGRFMGSSAMLGSSVQDLIRDHVMMPPDFMPERQRLIYKGYIPLIEEELAAWGDYYVIPADEMLQWTDAESCWMPHAMVVCTQDGTQYKKEIFLHPNGIISRIESYTIQPWDKTSWGRKGRSLLFDELGFVSDISICSLDGTFEDRRDYKWDSNDFVFIDRYPDFFDLFSTDISKIIKIEMRK
jgi:hypothetical protein